MDLNNSARSPLDIDLNEIPAASSAETATYSVEAAAEGEGETCGACGRLEADMDVLVCDGCETGYHLSCAGMRAMEAVSLLEWMCVECFRKGVNSKRWPLGKKKPILDINEPPPTDPDGEGMELEGVHLRNHTPGDNSFGGNAFVAPVTFPNLLYAKNGFACQKGAGILTHTAATDFKDILLCKKTMDRNLEDVEGIPFGRFSSGHDTEFRFPSQNPSERCLQALKEFIAERHGFLEKGWHVELRHSMGSYEPHVVYCSPDGKTFDSMSEVASHLGFMSNCTVHTERKTEGSYVQEKLYIPRKRKSTASTIVDALGGHKGSMTNVYSHELSSDFHDMESLVSRYTTTCNASEAGMMETGCTGFQQNNDGLPIQFEDLFILCKGHINARPSYHNASLIFPVGYKSCWHDMITGSLFICEVLNGGDSGPVFKIKRCSCSESPIPKGSTVLVRQDFGTLSAHHNQEKNNIISFAEDYDDDISIEMILSDPCPPMENDLITCLGTRSNGSYDMRSFNNFMLEGGSMHGKPRNPSCNLESKDEIGEICVEDRSSSTAWRRISEKIVGVCSDIIKRRGALKFFCKHIGNRTPWDMMDEKYRIGFASLEKFCGSSLSPSISSELWGENELNSDVLLKWLNQDRFGLDTEFVQEIIEQLPGVKVCSQYQFLKDRSSYSSSITVGNGLLVAKAEGGVVSRGEEVSGGRFGRPKKPRLIEEPARDPPPGKLLSSRLPPQIIGDFYQVLELLWRFYEILGLREPISLEELEEELLNPWFEKKILETETISSQQSDVMAVPKSSSSNESHPTASGENPHAYIQMETEARKTSAQASVASVTNRRFYGVVLVKAHSSLLGVLISELQSRVAALIDPSFDSGESKSRRGRKKDADSSISSKRIKLTMLPINELTWLELARRYILAVLSMDGFLDSADITARESGKVYRCLRGDGGVLCGSLTGVAGMEADALLLAEATKKIFGSLNRENDALLIEEDIPDVPGSSEKNCAGDGTIPDWAKPLEPVRKLPTNVGTRIRRCVYQALEKNPPAWAEEILLRSISKEVYKGNASGPTKKAVISVLAELLRDRAPPKPEKITKKKTAVSISDIIMKQCRIVLRRAAAADDSKVFCNLLGRKLINSTDNDVEGLLGSPAMVSRPLDFRTIDLRLAVGAYDGSYESFLEDVRQFWANVRTAFEDQPDFVELADTLSHNFESLYEQEVAPLVHKLVGYTKVESLSAETKNELNDILTTTSQIPKAPWDDGVCKVCGVDKDDDSVLLCDTCDAEYHTYCLDPPLARIPDGNWYCPSCVVSNRAVRDSPQLSQVIGRRRGKKYQGEVTRAHLEALRHLVTVVEGKEYWEFSVEERTFLLKVLGDDFLNSVLIRQHLEQSSETTAELQQKLRSFHAEWKSLKSREESLAARAAKTRTSIPNIVGEVGGTKELPIALRSNGTSVVQSLNLNGRSNSLIFSEDIPPLNGKGDESVPNRVHSFVSSEKNLNCNNQFPSPLVVECQEKDPQAVLSNSAVLSQKNERSFRKKELLSSTSVPQEINEPGRQIYLQDDLQESAQDIACQDAPSFITNELESYSVELNTIKNDLRLLQDLITSSESQLLRVALRREFLGSDSGGRLYWASVVPGRPSRIVVDGSLAMQHRDNPQESRKTSGKVSPLQQSEGSKACWPFLCDPTVSRGTSSQWVFYEDDEEIERLICWLKDDDQKERELKESILHWQKLRFQDSQRARILVRDENQTKFSLPMGVDKAAHFGSLVTKATALLERNFGPCCEIMKRPGKNSSMTHDDKMYRCECLEPIWPLRNHCLSCHRTLTDKEVAEHNENKCVPAPPAKEKHKEVTDSSKGKGHMKSDVPREACNLNASRLIKFQNAGSDCPYNLEEISCKFVTKDSNKELVQQIGLIGSNGVPSFVQHPSPFLGESMEVLISSQRKVAVPGNEPKDSDGVALSQGKRSTTDSGSDSKTENSCRNYSANETHELLQSSKPAVGSSDRRNRKSSNSHIPQQEVIVSKSSLRPLTGKAFPIARQLKINLLDMDAAIPEEALRPSKAHLQKRWAWREFVKSAETIYEMVQATIILEDMIKTDYLRKEWWYWSSLSAAAKTSTLSSLALRIYSLDSSIVYEKSSPNIDRTDSLKLSNIEEHEPLASLEVAEKLKVSRKSNKKRKEPEA